jgi:pSer/pThr/pTyr-binding forkhead associated (FHA) protein
VESDRKGPVIEVPSLIIKGGPTDGTIFALTEGTSILVGSGRLANIQLAGEQIGSAHARITWDDAGISITDNGSMGGTFVNGEAVVTGPLADGDRIAFVPSGSKHNLPKLLVRIPPGTVMVTVAPPPPDEPLTSPAPAEAQKPAPAPFPKGGTAAKRPAKPKAPPPWEAALDAIREIEWQSPKFLVPVGGLALVLLGLLIMRLVLGHAPVLLALQPATGEPGQVISLSGQYFPADVAKITVRFGDASAQVMGGTATGLTVTVPEVPAAVSGQEVKVVVETRGGHSQPLGFRLTRTPKVAALDPEAALPGETVTLRGQSLGGAVTVTVGGAAARVIEAKGDVIKFQVPNLPPSPARTEPVLVQIGDRASKAVDLLIGKLPIILEVSPPRGDADERVTLRGRGFAASAEANKVTFSGAPALVLSASASELQVAAPLAPAGIYEAEIVAEAAGRASTNRAVFTYAGTSAASFHPRFVAADAGATRAQAFVASQFGPLILLGSKDEAKSVQDRAVALAAALNAAFDAGASGFEARGESVVVAGRPEALFRATADDGAAYEAPPGVSVRNPKPAPAALAAHWAALLSDYAALFLHGQRPVKMLAASPRGRAFVDLQSELGWRPGASVTPGRAGSVSPDLLGRLREMAFGLGKESAATVGAALEGTWEGELADADGSHKPITVKIRQAGGKLAGTLLTGGRVSLEQPLQSVAAQAGTVTFSVRSGAAVRFFVGRLDASGITGSVHTGAPGGPAAGTFSLKYAP